MKWVDVTHDETQKGNGPPADVPAGRCPFVVQVRDYRLLLFWLLRPM